MAGTSDIEWTEATWSPVTGCSKISPGCKHCYANRLALRLKAIGQPNYINGFEDTLHPHTLQIPLGWKRTRTIFVNSMSDLFHEDVPLEFIRQVFATMHKSHWHRFQILTKRSNRVSDLDSKLTWTPNIWMGVSVESQQYLYRIDHLRATNAHVKFLSLEPLLASLPNLDLTGIDWVIVGGESGPGARRIEPDWVRNIRDQCVGQKVAFFFKQWGGVFKKRTGRVLDGRTWDELPNQTQIWIESKTGIPNSRQMPL
jgi:protein gp37